MTTSKPLCDIHNRRGSAGTRTVSEAAEKPLDTYAAQSSTITPPSYRLNRASTSRAASSDDAGF